MKYKATRFLSVLLAFLMLISGQSVLAHDDHEVEPPTVVEDAEEMDLLDWEGEFINVASFLDEDDLQEGLQEISDDHGVTVEEFKEEYIEHSGTAFKGLKFQDNAILFYDCRVTDEAEPVYRIAYDYLATYQGLQGNHPFEWYVFEAKELPEVEADTDDVDEEADAKADEDQDDNFDPQELKYIALMPIHGEELLAHFHIRYASEIDELWEAEDWYPVMVSAAIQDEQMVAMLDHHDRDSGDQHDE